MTGSPYTVRVQGYGIPKVLSSQSLYLIREIHIRSRSLAGKSTVEGKLHAGHQRQYFWKENENSIQH